MSEKANKKTSSTKDARDEVQAMKHQMEMLTRSWDPAEKALTFSTQVAGNYLQGINESASRVHFFAEVTALDEHGSLKEEFIMEDKV